MADADCACVCPRARLTAHLSCGATLTCPWRPLLPPLLTQATGCICLVLGKLFLNLQRNYEADFGLWQVDAPPSRLAGGLSLVNASSVPALEVTHQATSSSKVTLLAGGVATEVDASCGAQACSTANVSLPACADTLLAGSVPVSGEPGFGWICRFMGSVSRRHPLSAATLSDPIVRPTGLDFKTPTAQACCDACRAHEKRDGQPGKCNSWVWCPEDKCWAPDIWDHRLHECWLKVQDDPASPKVNHRGAFSDAFRAEHKTAPEKTPWMAGVLL